MELLVNHKKILLIHIPIAINSETEKKNKPRLRTQLTNKHFKLNHEPTT